MSRYWVFIFGLLFLFAAGCSGNEGENNGAAQDAQPTSTPIPTLAALAPTTYTVVRGDVVNELSFQGRWLPRDQNPLSFETGGVVRRVLVQRGDTVMAGQLLADLNITDLENSLTTALLALETAQYGAETSDEGGVQSVIDAEIALASANLSLDNTRLSSPWQSGQSARLGVETAQRNLEQAQRNYDDVISRPDSSASAVDQAYQGLASAQESLRSAQISYGASGQGWAQYEIQLQQAENSVRQAELALERARNGVGSSDAEAQVRSAQLQVDQLRAQIASASLYSPIDGVVLEITIQPGAQAEAYKAVITVGRPQPLEAIANVTYTDVQKMGVSLVGVCSVLNQPDTAVQCIIRRLPLTSSDADQTVRVAATLPDVPSGQIIDITMPLETRTNVLWLPPQAVRTFQNRTFVVIQTPEGQRRADVQIGLRTTEQVEILSGVAEGDVVVLP